MGRVVLVGMGVDAPAVLVGVDVGGSAAGHLVEDPNTEQGEHRGNGELEQAVDVCGKLGANDEDDDGGDEQGGGVAESPDGADKPRAAQGYAAGDQGHDGGEVVWVKGVAHSEH